MNEQTGERGREEVSIWSYGLFPLIVNANGPVSAYRDRRFKGAQEDYVQALHTSTTVYIGNLSFYTTEEQIYEVFHRTGEIKKIIMGLDKNTMTPCGFCFVQYYTREDTEDAVKYISGSILDDRPIRADFDWGFEEGRQWGRGRSGGQVRDEYRTDFDPGRGGYGKGVQEEIAKLRYRELGSPEMGLPRAFEGRIFPGIQPVPYPGRQGGGGPQRRESGRKRGREEGPAVPSEPAVKETTEPETRPERNPRFRDRGDDSDEEGGKV